MSNYELSALGQAVTALILQIFRLNGSLLAAGDELARPAGQSSSRWQVMGCIDERALSVAAVARTMGLARQSVQRTADLLVQDGLAEYRENPEHRRAKLVVLTAPGVQVLRDIEARQNKWANQLGAALDAKELAAARRVLETLSGLLQDAGRDDPGEV